MSEDIQKLSVFDPRIVQNRPKYAVTKGAASVSNTAFVAIGATASQHTYNILVPSQNVYVDRALEWSATTFLASNASYTVAPVPGSPIAQYGRDWALCAFPLNSLCSTLTAAINNTTVTINSNDVLKEVLRLTDYKKNRLQRTCPTMLDKYQSYSSCAGAVNNPLAGYDSQSDYSETPNGAWYDVVFTDLQGTPLGTSGKQPAYGGAPPQFYNPLTTAPYVSKNGQPALPDAWNAALAYNVADYVIYNGAIWQVNPGPAVVGTPPAGGVWTNIGNVVGFQFPINFRFGSTEKLVISPFVFADEHESDTGLNLQGMYILKEYAKSLLFIEDSYLLRETPQVSTTTLHRKIGRGTQVMTGSNRKNVENWAIRRESPKPYCFGMVNPQRLHGSRRLEI